MPQTSNRSMRAFLWLFLLVGMGAIACGIWTLAQSLRCRHWPTTEGVIQSAKMESHSGSENGDTYSASISYDYQVAGTYYTGTRLAFGAMSASSKYAQRILDRYPVGKKVPVHYSPGNPELAVLETGVHGGTWIAFGVGTLFVLAAWSFMTQLAPAKPGAQTAQTKANSQQPPILMGVIFVLMGSFVFFMEPADGIPGWIAFAPGGLFLLIGLFLLAYRLQNKLYSKALLLAGVLTFLAIFHWLSFGPGERLGTATTPFSQHDGVNVKTWFAAFTVLIDLALLAILARYLMKARNCNRVAKLLTSSQEGRERAPDI